MRRLTLCVAVILAACHEREAVAPPPRAERSAPSGLTSPEPASRMMQLDTTSAEASASQRIAESSIVAAVGSARVEGLQNVTIPLEANWNHPTFGDYFAWRILGDTLPASGGNYSPSPRTFSDGYGTFLTSLQIPLPEPKLAEKAAEARDRALAAQGRIDATLAAPSSYAGGRLTPAARVRIAFYTTERDRWRDEYALLARKAQGQYASLAQAIVEFNNPAHQKEATSPDGLTLSYRTYNITPDLSAWIESAGKQGLRRITRVPIASRYMIRNRVPGQIPPNVEPGHPDFDWSEKVFRAEEVLFSEADVQARRIGVFTVQPGRWFNGSVLSAFQSGPWARTDVRETTFWGDGGVLGRRTAQLVVAFEPAVTFKTTSAQLARAEALIRSTPVLLIGPLAFRMTGDGAATVRVDPGASSISVASPPGKAWVVGVVTQALP